MDEDHTFATIIGHVPDAMVGPDGTAFFIFVHQMGRGPAFNLFLLPCLGKNFLGFQLLEIHNIYLVCCIA
jgi:hypothetical protein